MDIKCPKCGSYTCDAIDDVSDENYIQELWSCECEYIWWRIYKFVEEKEYKGEKDD